MGRVLHRRNSAAMPARREMEVRMSEGREKPSTAHSYETPREGRIGYYVNEKGDLVPHDREAQADFVRLTRNASNIPSPK